MPEANQDLHEFLRKRGYSDKEISAWARFYIDAMTRWKINPTEVTTLLDMSLRPIWPLFLYALIVLLAILLLHYGLVVKLILSLTMIAAIYIGVRRIYTRALLMDLLKKSKTQDTSLENGSV